MKVTEAAVRLGVTPRRVRALIESGHVSATKVGSVWEIADLGLAGRDRRPLSLRSRELLATALHTRSLAGLVGQDRARTASRIRDLRSSDDAARLLVEWWGGDPAGHDVFVSNLVEHALAGNREHVESVLRRPRREYLRSRDDLAGLVSSERAIRGLSLGELATSAAVSTADVRAVERADLVRSPSTIRRILAAVGIEPTALPDLVPA